jgi:hypothetical protein
MFPGFDFINSLRCFPLLNAQVFHERFRGIWKLSLIVLAEAAG